MHSKHDDTIITLSKDVIKIYTPNISSLPAGVIPELFYAKIVYIEDFDGKFKIIKNRDGEFGQIFETREEFDKWLIIHAL